MGHAQRNHLAGLVARHPAPVQLVDKLFGAVVDARAYADLLQEVEQARVLVGMVVGQDFAHVARVGKPVALGHPQEQAREPVGEAAADQQQMVVLELVEEPLGRQVLALQRADEFEHVLFGNDVRR